MTAPTRLLSQLANVVTAAPRRRGAVLRAAEAALSTLNASSSLPLAARWFLRTQSVRGTRRAGDDFWASRVTPEAATELRRLVPRFVVLYGESGSATWSGTAAPAGPIARWPCCPSRPQRPCNRGSSGSYSTTSPPRKPPPTWSPKWICFHALGVARAPAGAVLRVRYEYEHPDWRHGHFMMRLEVNDETVVRYWPELKTAEFNHVDLKALTDVCRRLTLRHVRPLQLATFLAVLANATADGTESWGGENGVFFFREGHIPFTLKRLSKRRKTSR